MSIFVTGDTHGATKLGYGSVDGFMQRLGSQNFPTGRALSKDDYVIIVGDFGGVWSTNRHRFEESKEEKYELDWLNDKPWTTLFLPGNHENYDRLIGCRDERLLNSWMYETMPEEEKDKLRHGYPEKNMYGGKVREIRSSVLMLEDGIFEIDGDTFWVYGGAESHDISGGIIYPPDYQEEWEFLQDYQVHSGDTRVEGISWWKAERTNPEREAKAEKILEEHDWKVDHVLTHAGPSDDVAYLGFTDKSDINDFLGNIAQKIDCKDWYFGHYHKNVPFPWNGHRMLYDDIICLDNQKEYDYGKMIQNNNDIEPEK